MRGAAATVLSAAHVSIVASRYFMAASPFLIDTRMAFPFPMFNLGGRCSRVLGRVGFGCVFGLVFRLDLVGFTRLLWTQAGVPVLLEALAVTVGRYVIVEGDRVRARKERSTAV